MKRKRPPDSSSDQSKRRRISPSTKTPHPNRDNDEKSETVSPLTNMSNTFDKISPRPAPLISKQLESKRILSKKKRINLTDDEDNIIMEGDDEFDHSFDDENEAEIGRGAKQKNKDSNQEDIDLDNDFFDPFNVEQAQNENDSFNPIPGTILPRTHSLLLTLASFA